MGLLLREVSVGTDSPAPFRNADARIIAPSEGGSSPAPGQAQVRLHTGRQPGRVEHADRPSWWRRSGSPSRISGMRTVALLDQLLEASEPPSAGSGRTFRGSRSCNGVEVEVGVAIILECRHHP